MAMEEDKEDHSAIAASIRSAKKASRPTKIGVSVTPVVGKGRSKDRKAKRSKSSSGALVGPDKVGPKGKNEGVRARRTDAVGGMGKKKGETEQ